MNAMDLAFVSSNNLTASLSRTSGVVSADSVAGNGAQLD